MSYPRAKPEFVGKHLVSMVGFSPLARFFLVIVLARLDLTAVGVGFRKVDWVLPDTTGRA